MDYCTLSKGTIGIYTYGPFDGTLMARTRPTWEKAAIRTFESLPRRVYQRDDFGRILMQMSADWNAPKYVTAGRLMKVLAQHGDLRHLAIELDRPPEALADAATAKPKTVTRYSWGDPHPYAVGISLRSGAYLSHASAVFLHGLTQEVPKTIYVNKEQSPKTSTKGVLTQEGLDRAFQNRQRVSTYIFSYGDYRYVLLNGKFTNRLEVSEIQLDSAGGPVSTTKLERTLIDIAVRPSYAGGIFEVTKAYAAAKERISVATLVATLRKLEYVYPYHQAIGYYMERTGYDNAKLDKLRALGLNYDFYLANNLPARRFVPEWRLWTTEGM